VFHLQVDDDCLSPAYRQTVSQLVRVPTPLLEDFQRGLLLAAVVADLPECSACRVSFHLRQLVPGDPSRHQLSAQVVYLSGVAPTSGLAGYCRTMRIRRGFEHACAACWQPPPDAPLGFTYEVSCHTKTHPHERGAL
jgi:hypothetical protein